MSQSETAGQSSASPKTPLGLRLRILWRQCELFSRYLKFHWRVTQPAPVTPHGFKFYGNRHVVSGRFEPVETGVFKRLISQVDILVNVGANVGYYCCLARQAGKPVLAFEPIDLNVRFLLANIEVNGWADQFELFPICLGSQPGLLKIYGGGTGASLIRGWANIPDAHANLAPVNTLDSVLGSRLDKKTALIFVDIEGAEFFMLQGAKNVLASNPKHWWFMEINILSHQPNGGINDKLKDTFDVFWRAGYEAWAVKDPLERVEPERIDAIAREGKDSIGCCNFLFLPKGSNALADS